MPMAAVAMSKSMLYACGSIMGATMMVMMTGPPGAMTGATMGAVITAGDNRLGSITQEVEVITQSIEQQKKQ